MEISDFCCTYEQAVRLKELGVVQNESFFYFNPPSTTVLPMLLHNNKFRGSTCPDAYNTSELGVMMPNDFIHYFGFPGYTTPKSREYEVKYNQWSFIGSDKIGFPNDKIVFGGRYDHNGNINIGTPTFYGAESHVKAANLIYLLENIMAFPVERVNERLLNYQNQQ